MCVCIIKYSGGLCKSLIKIISTYISNYQSYCHWLLFTIVICYIINLIYLVCWVKENHYKDRYYTNVIVSNHNKSFKCFLVFSCLFSIRHQWNICRNVQKKLYRNVMLSLTIQIRASFSHWFHFIHEWLQTLKLCIPWPTSWPYIYIYIYIIFFFFFFKLFLFPNPDP